MKNAHPIHALRLLLLTLFFVQLGNTSKAQQQLTIGQNAQSSFSFGPLYRSFPSSNWNNSHYVYLYTNQELSGIVPGSLITSLEWFMESANALPGANFMQIRMQNTNQNTIPVANNDFLNESSGSLVVFSDSTYQLTNQTGWQSHVLQIPFVYSGGNLKIMVSYHHGGSASGPILFRVTGAAGRAAGVASHVPASARPFESMYSNSRPDVRITYSNTPCQSPPTVGMIQTTRPAICPGDATTLFLTGFSGGPGQTFQWESSPNNSNWTAIPNANQAYVNVAPTSNTYYRCRVNCGGPAFSPVRHIQVTGAPISGTFTIQANAPAGPNVFNSFNEAFNALTCSGINGPVVLNVAPGSGPYVEQIQIGAITGLSATNTITVNGHDNVLDFEATISAERATIQLNNTRHINFNNLHIKASGNSWGVGVWLRNQTEHIQFHDCIIETPQALAAFAGIVASASATDYFQAGDNASNIKIERCHFLNNGNALVLNNSTQVPGGGVMVSECVFEDFRIHGIRIQHHANFEIRQNQFFLKRHLDNPGPSLTPILIMGNYTGGKIEQNDIRDIGFGSNLNQGISGIRVSNGFATNASPLKIVNNKIYRLSNANPRGIYLFSATHVQIHHNTIANMHLDPVSGSFLIGIELANTTNNVDIKNNIIWLKSPSAVIRGYDIDNGVNNLSIDYNNVFTHNQGNIGRVGNSSFTTPAAWQAAGGQGFDLNGVFGDPVLANAEGGNLKPLDTLVNGVGTALGVLEDFFGQPRPSSHPDLGAIEFAPIQSDMDLVTATLLQNLCPSSQDTITFEIRHALGPIVNFAQNPLTIHWQLSGPVNSSGTFTINSGTLIRDSILTVMVSGANFFRTGTYALQAWLDTNAINQSSANDTIRRTFNIITTSLEAIPRFIQLASPADTVTIRANSRFLAPQEIFISEVCQLRQTNISNGRPLAGWPTWLRADDYIEITGVPHFDLAGYTLEQYNNTTMVSTHTFGYGTLFGPNGTMVVAVGQLSNSVPRPEHFYYHGTGNFTGSFLSGDAIGRVIRDPSGNVVDAVGYNGYLFPAFTGVDTTHWNLPISFSFANHSGMRLMGPDNNTGTNWALTSGNIWQDPGVVNAGTSASILTPIPGLNWQLNGVVVDTLISHLAGPFPANGTYVYIVTLPTPCGILTDTVTIQVGPLPGALVQWIHNAHDPALQQVDLWIDSTRLVPNWGYRTETGFLEVPANRPVVITLTTPGAPDTSGAIIQKIQIFSDTVPTVQILSGVFSGAGQPLNWFYYQPGQILATRIDQSDILFFNGMRDGSRIDLDEVTVPMPFIVSGLNYGAFEGYVPLAKGNYSLEPKINGAAIARFQLPLQTWSMEGLAVTVIVDGQLGSAGSASVMNMWLARGQSGSLRPLLLQSGIGLPHDVPQTDWVQVYPNPASQWLQIAFNKSNMEAYSIELVDLSGRILIRKTGRSTDGTPIQVDVSAIPAGSCWLRITQETHQTVLPVVINR
jgi:hypothetical protein